MESTAGESELPFEAHFTSVHAERAPRVTFIGARPPFLLFESTDPPQQRPLSAIARLRNALL